MTKKLNKTLVKWAHSASLGALIGSLLGSRPEMIAVMIAITALITWLMLTWVINEMEDPEYRIRRIVLSEEGFYKLVSGSTVEQDGTYLILQDIGYETMHRLIEDVKEVNNHG